jgi:glycosyltransferase involved in cell wall biosynthesis
MPDLSVVICSLNGEEGIDRTLHAVARQTIRAQIEVIVVDDGSTDATAAVARSHGARVERHAVNRGLAAARNTGVRAATGPVVAFLDDDCEPAPDWAEKLLGGYRDDVAGVGGCVVPVGASSVFGRYLERHNPLSPIEADLARSERPGYRLWRYLVRAWRDPRPSGARDVYSLVGANMSYRRDVLVEAGMFDERFTFGAEEVDACRRIRRVRPDLRLVIEPSSSVMHHFDASLRDTLRRSRAYGRGSARLFRNWPGSAPTCFPLPILVTGLLAAGTRRPGALVAAAVAPNLLWPSGVLDAVRNRRPERLMDAYVHLAREAADDVGFAEGLWRYRNLRPVLAGGDS